jgi:hypothetical protein
MGSQKAGWRTYQLISLRDLMNRGLRTPGGAPVVECMPCLPDVDVSAPNVCFGQVMAPDFPVLQYPSDVSWYSADFSIRDGQAYLIRNAVVQGELGIITVGDFVIHDVLTFALPKHISRFEWVDDRSLSLPPPATETRIGAASHLLCGHVGNRNYAHWLTDVVPNLLVYPFHNAFEGTTLLWPKLRNVWQEQTLELLPEATGRSKFLEPEEYVTCETLCVVPRIRMSDYCPHPHRMFLFDVMRERSGARGQPNRRIYVSRKDTNARRMLNEDAVIRLLEEHGFETVSLTGMPVAQQAALFADATHIISGHGAGLANLVFCRPGTVLCELHMDTYVQWAFRRLGSLPEIVYGCLVGQAVEHDEWIHKSTWRAPVEQMLQMLSLPPFGTGGRMVAAPTKPEITREKADHTMSTSVVTPSCTVRKAVIDKVWRGADPFLGFPSQLYASDTQGWNSAHPYLSQAIDKIRPSVIAEIGVWKGGSVLTMASRLRDLGCDAVVIAIDTWLGSWEHWHNDNLFPLLDMMNGRPAIYQKFLSNVVRAGLQAYVVPIPLDSANAAQLLKLRGIRPDIVHLDGCHDYCAVMGDLALWWPQINPGGMLLGDDYYDNGAWPEVRRAIDGFFASEPHGSFEHLGGKCRVSKR